MGMRLIGARTVDELTPDLVDASALHAHVGQIPVDNLYSATCTCATCSSDFGIKTLNNRPTTGSCTVQD